MMGPRDSTMTRSWVHMVHVPIWSAVSRPPVSETRTYERQFGHLPTPPGALSQMISIQRLQKRVVAVAGMVQHGSSAHASSG